MVISYDMGVQGEGERCVVLASTADHDVVTYEMEEGEGEGEGSIRSDTQFCF